MAPRIKTAPTEILDYLGNDVSPGEIVAFNLSGAVAFGVVVKAEITETHVVTFAPGYTQKFDIRIKLLYDHSGLIAGHISRVKNPVNLAVINLPDIS